MGTSNKKYCIYGTGGFGRETLTCLSDMISESGRNVEDLTVFMVADEFYTDTQVLGIPIIRESEFDPDCYEVVVAIGDPHTRKKVVDQLPMSTSYATIIHPSAVISKWVDIGEGSIITAGTVITCNIQIGKHAHLNLNTTVGHDCVIGNYFTTAPAANISGGCTFGECVYFGTASSVRQGIRIVDNVTIGMGGVVVKDIENQGVYVGNPLKKLIK